MTIKHWFSQLKDKVSRKIAWCLPKPIVMWCYYRVAAHVTSNEFSNDDVDSITMMDAISSWCTDNEII